MAYIGNDDFRGYLAARASGPGGMDINARYALDAGVGNDGGYNPNLIESYFDSPTADRTAERNALINWTTNEYGNWLRRNEAGSTLAWNGGGSSSSTNTPSNADELALINDSMDTTNSALSRIDNERSVGLDNIINSWRESKNKLATDRGLAERDYNTTKTNTTNDYLDSRAGIRRDAGNMYNSAKRVLGAAGAGRSSALDLLLPFATGREAAIRFSDTGNKFSRNQQALDTNWSDTTRQFDEMGTSLDKQKEDKQRELEQGLLQNETSLQDQLAQLQLQRTALQGGNVTSALAGITPIRERVNSLLDRIVGLGRQYSGAVKPTGEVKFAAPTLDTYNYSKFAAPTLQGGGYDPRADYVSPLTSILQKKEKEQK